MYLFHIVNPIFTPPRSYKIKKKRRGAKRLKKGKKKVSSNAYACKCWLSWYRGQSI